MGLLDGKVVIVTGAGQGLGRAHALELAAQGAKVVVNDIGDAAQAVADEITASGGTAKGIAANVADWDSSQGLIDETVEAFGGLDALVNNAGIVRDRMLLSLSDEEWDAVLTVNLKGHFLPMRHAGDYWRTKSKAGEQVDARVVNTSSGAGLLGSVGQGNYAAAKAGVVALTQVASAEWARYGVKLNAIAPAARTPMTEGVFSEMMAKPDEGFDAMDPANVSPLVAWLCSSECNVTGRVFESSGGEIVLFDGWQRAASVNQDQRWDAETLTSVINDLVKKSPAPLPVYGAS